MSDEKSKAAESLRRAIKGEEDGHKFYNLLSKKAANPSAKRLLEGLRDDEVRHKQTLVELYEKFVGGEIGPLPERGISPLAKLFSEGHLEDHKTEMEFINLAIEAELAATKYYQNERKLFDDSEFVALFDRMADEEHHHFELLQAEKEALAGNYHWFGYDSGSPMEH